MNLKQHTPHLYRLVRYGLINVYLVVEGDGLTVVDTAVSGTETHVAEAAEKLGLPVRRILLTHAHVDHVGSLDALHNRYPDAEVIISARDARFLQGDMSLDENEPQAKLRGGFPTIQTRPTRLLEDGDTVGSLRAVASPGHTPGHMAFWDTRDGTLIAGDAFQTQAGLAVAGDLRLLFPLPALATWHKPTALGSARKLTTLEPKRLAVGHGPVLENPTNAMRQVTETFARQLESSL